MEEGALPPTRHLRQFSDLASQMGPVTLPPDFFIFLEISMKMRE